MRPSGYLELIVLVLCRRASSRASTSRFHLTTRCVLGITFGNLSAAGSVCWTVTGQLICAPHAQAKEGENVLDSVDVPAEAKN